MELNVKLRPEAAQFITESLDHTPLPGVEVKSLAIEIQSAIREAAQAAKEADGESDREG